MGRPLLKTFTVAKSLHQGSPARQIPTAGGDFVTRADQHPETPRALSHDIGHLRQPSSPVLARLRSPEHAPPKTDQRTPSALGDPPLMAVFAIVSIAPRWQRVFVPSLGTGAPVLAVEHLMPHK